MDRAAGDTAAVVARILGLDEFAAYVEQYGSKTDTKSATADEALREAKKAKGKLTHRLLHLLSSSPARSIARQHEQHRANRLASFTSYR